MNASSLRIAAVLGLLGGYWPQALVAQEDASGSAGQSRPPSSELFPEAAADDQVQGRSGELFWKNGDTLRGRLAAGGALKQDAPGRLIWKSELFAEPLLLDLNRLRSVQFDFDRKPAAASDRGAAPHFRVITRERNSIDGELAAIDAEHIYLRRAGTEEPIAITRDRVVEIVGLDSPDLLLHGFNRAGTWSHRNSKAHHDNGWDLAANGRFESKRWRAQAQFDLKAESSFMVDLQLSTSGQRPDFSLGLDETSKGLRLETWQDELVLNFGDLFAPVMTLDKKDRELHLLVGIDARAGTARVYTIGGRQLAMLDFSQAGSSWNVRDALIDLKNKGANLAVERLVVRRWNPNSKQSQSPTISEGVQLGDGTVIAGDLKSLRLDDGKALTLGTGISRRRVALSELASITLARPVRVGTRQTGLGKGDDDSVSFSNGQYLSGELLAINEGRVRMQVGFSDRPIDLSLEGVRGLNFRDAAETPIGNSATDHLFSDGQHLTGEIVDGSSVGKVIAWKCDGAENPVAIRGDSNSRVVRGVLPGGAGKGWHQADDNRDRLVLRSNEVVACRVGEIDEQSVHFSHSVAARKSIPLDQVRAVEFAGQTERRQGFDDLRWQVLSEDPAAMSRTENRIAFLASKNGKISHASALAAREVKFDLNFGRKGQGGAMRMRLFGTSADDADGWLELTILASGSRVWVTRIEQGRPFMFSNNGLEDIRKYPLPVCLKLVDTRVEVYIDDQLALSEELDPETATGHALQFSVDPMSVRYGGPQSVISISDLEVIREKGSHQDLQVSAQAQHEALTVPRFRRNNPQRHVLIAGNGDLLRGHLIGASASEISFRSRLEEVRLPRHRIAGAIWLDEMADDGDAEEALQIEDNIEASPRENELQVILNDGSRIELLARQLNHEFLSGDSRRLGACRIPLADVRELRTAGFTALDLSANGKMAYADWQLAAAQEPELPSEGADDVANGAAHQLVGSEAGAVQLPLLAGGEFDLAGARGNIIVLDFWATWCGPCVKAIPEYLDVISGFDSRRVQFVGINQSESAQVIAGFLKRRDWKLNVALDQDGRVGASYGVTGIPHTVVVDGEGKIAWVHTGYTPNGAAALKQVIEGLLAE